MFKRACVAAIAAILIAAPLAPAQSQGSGQPSGQPYGAPAAGASAKPAKMSAQERRKKCGAEWKELKAAGKIEKGMTWPKYWKQCNARLKAART